MRAAGLTDRAAVTVSLRRGRTAAASGRTLARDAVDCFGTTLVRVWWGRGGEVMSMLKKWSMLSIIHNRPSKGAAESHIWKASSG